MGTRRRKQRQKKRNLEPGAAGDDGGRVPLARSSMNEFRRLMKAGVFTDQTLDEMTEMIGKTVLNSQSTDRDRNSAYKTLLLRAKTEHEINTEKQETHNHLHVGMSWDQLFADSAKGYSDRERIQDEINQASETDSESS